LFIKTIVRVIMNLGDGYENYYAIHENGSSIIKINKINIIAKTVMYYFPFSLSLD